MELSRLCAALIEIFAYFTALLLFFTGLTVSVDTLLHRQIAPAVARIIATLGKLRRVGARPGIVRENL